ncbi:hypothetical protein EZY14_007420 [Kordia sp. TARA_039_SRF]|nr:hypothetical protein EZY14_007420 [Kordia sp. TARA_039_SRF]
MKKWREETATIQAFKLGYCYGFVSRQDKAVLGNLIEEILEYGSTSEILSAFRKGAYHAHQERKYIEQNIKMAMEKSGQKQIETELSELQKLRAKNKDKSHDKSR